MPAIDLARLRKQSARLVDFFFVPDEFIQHLHKMLDSYVNYTVRKPPANAPDANLQSYRIPTVVVKQIELELTRIAGKSENADAALDLADHLWDETFLETRLLAAFLLGHIPPQEGRLLARLTAWTRQVHRLRRKCRQEGLLRQSILITTSFLKCQICCFLHIL